ASEFPLLQDIGRGKLTVQIPPDIAVGITFNGEHSVVTTLDMGQLDLERLTFGLDDGDVVVQLPLYRPLSPSVVDSNGNWTVRDGNLRVLAPEDLGLRLAFDRATNAEPSNFDDLIYQLLLEPPNV